MTGTDHRSDGRGPWGNAFASPHLQDEGRAILAALYGAMRGLRLYPLENEVVQQALTELHATVGRFLAREGGLELRVLGDFFFLNEKRLRLDLRNFSTFGALARALRSHGVGEIAVSREVAPGEWAPFLSLLLRPGAEASPYEELLERLSGTPVRAIEVRPQREQTPDLKEEALEGARRTYAYSVRVAREALSDVRMGRATHMGRVRKAVQSIVDQVLANEPSILAMTQLRDFDEYTFTHSVNVSIFSVVMGQRLGFGRQELYELGLAALFHDVGKMRTGEELVNKPEGLSDAEWKILREHPTEGLLALFRMHGFMEVPYRQMLVAYEHHMKIDGTGYPKPRRPRTPGLFSRIVAVADGFDAGTSVRSYQFRPWAPDEVLREMRDNPKRGFDPLLVKALITATGVYPVGTLVVLDTFELAVVSRANPDPAKPHQPEVKILADGMGIPLAEPLVTRLDEVDPRTGDPLRTIIKTTNPARYDLRVADYVT